MNNTNFDSATVPRNRHSDFKERELDLRDSRLLSMMEQMPSRRWLSVR